MEAEAINQLNNTLSDLEGRSADIRVYLDYAGKKERLEEVVGLSEDPELWNDPKKAQEIGKERKMLEGIVLTLEHIATGIDDNRMLIEMAVEEADEAGFAAVEQDVAALCALWLGFAVTMREPPYVTSLRLPLTPAAAGDSGLVERLKALSGVTDAVMVADESAVYIKVDTELLDRASLERLIEQAPERAAA